MSKYKVGDRVVVCSAPAAKIFHGRAGTIVRLDIIDIGSNRNVLFICVELDNDYDGRMRSWTEEAFRKITKLEQVLK